MFRITKRTRQTFVSILGLCIVGYFLYHTIQGDRGWFAMLRLQHEVKGAEATLSQLQKDREALEHRTQLMRPGSLDPDLLDEKARELLSYSRPNEIVVLTPTATPPKNNVVERPVLLQRSK